ncbi:hypothetical protein V5799_029788 [Amblyomma americanum]|uniref:Cytochrome n=1 Tax=Amblyomma americanum TaxID=6943 RepID=A0AAQ4EQK8_AMBAM
MPAAFFLNKPQVTMRTDQMHPIVGKMVIHVRGDEWRRMRSCVTSGFTSSKLKQMIPHIAESAEVFMDMLDGYADTEKEVNLRLQFQALSMDYIGQAAFGIETCFQRELNDIFFTTARRVLPGVMTGPAHMVAPRSSIFTPAKAGASIHARRQKKKKRGHALMRNRADVRCQVQRIILMPCLRKLCGLPRGELRKPDILQNLLDAEIEEEALTEAVMKSETKENADGPKKRLRALSPREVIMNATLLFMGGFETTSIAMCYLTFLLAKHQDVQDKLREEVKEAVGEQGELDYDTITKKLKYLVQVVEEGLRLYPPAVVATSRQAEEDFEWNGMKFKAGTCVMAPTYQLHRDPRYWVDPDTFDPERFSAENESSIHKMAFQPFGVGPRHCVGFQMARMEIRYTLARLVQRYRVDLGESQKGEMRMDSYAMVSSPENGPWLKFYRL